MTNTVQYCRDQAALAREYADGLAEGDELKLEFLRAAAAFDRLVEHVDAGCASVEMKVRLASAVLARFIVSSAKMAA